MVSLSVRTWALAAVISCAVVAAGVLVGYGTAPGAGDPLARPARLAAGIVVSAGAIDTQTALLVDQHTELSRRAAVLQDLVRALDRIEGHTGRVAGLVDDLEGRTKSVIAAAGGLPSQIKALSGPAGDGQRSAVRLQASVGSLAVGLDRVAASLRSMLADTQALVPRATTVADRLEDIQKDTQLLGLLRSLLAMLGIQ